MGTAARGIIQRIRIPFYLTTEESRSQRIENLLLSSSKKDTGKDLDFLVVWKKALQFYFACILLDRISVRTHEYSVKYFLKYAVNSFYFQRYNCYRLGKY